GRSSRRAIVLIGGPMPLIAAALGYELHLCATPPAFSGERVGGFGAHFLDGIYWRIGSQGKSLTGAEIVGVQTIQGVIALISARPSNGTVPAAECIVVAAGGNRDPRGIDQQTQWVVADVERELVHE